MSFFVIDVEVEVGSQQWSLAVLGEFVRSRFFRATFLFFSFSLPTQLRRALLPFSNANK